MSESSLYHRRSIRLKEYDYSLNGVYFITICIRDKKQLLGQIVDNEVILNNIGQAVDVCWQSIPKHFPEVELGEYVIMPNHLHGIICINTVGANHHLPPNKHGTSMTVGSIIRGFKIGVSKQIGYSPWQRNYYEHIIRSQQSHKQITNYIINNPINWETDRYCEASHDISSTTMEGK